MAYRNKTYVAFDADRDIRYYYLMKAWRDRDNDTFNFHDAHDLNTSRDTSQEQSIKANLRKRFQNSKAFVLLVGEGTRYLRKFVKWEIEQAIRLDLPIIVVNLNNKKAMDESRCPPLLRDALAMHVPFKQSIVQYALDNWPDSHREHRRNNESGPYYYKNSVYQRLGLQ
ncbi:TIR domain-containing protein [Thioalkalivibrio sp. ALE23]|uniref:TIR domain-containing protein n=1 Tax=Thioalkalivibrio sp. ALE23 TaxID=1265495 RepID=UPI0009DA032E|nr:TIR domain-containing protein [Thioalkalivibrio sp. ALE23]